MGEHENPTGKPGQCNNYLRIKNPDSDEDIINPCQCSKYKGTKENQKTRAILAGVCLGIGLFLALLFVFTTHVFSNFDYFTQVFLWQLTALIFLLTCSYLILSSIVDKVKLK